MNGLVIGAILALGMMQQTDTTFAVDGAERLQVETMGGSIIVDVWDRAEVRVRAEHSSRTFVDVDRRRGVIDIEAEARRGPANIVDFHITVPRTMALDLEGMYADITVEGSDGAVEAETMQGDITIRGGRGTVQVSSTMGKILVEGAEGRIEIESSTADIHVRDSSGEIFAESAAGSIVLENVDATTVDIGSTGGRVYFEGSLDPSGTYFFGAHGGSITIVVPEGAEATFNLATVHGSITSNLSGESRSFQRGERHQFEVGGGGALVEAESYGGRIRVLRQGSEGARAPEPMEHGVAMARPEGGVRVDVRVPLGPAIAARVSSVVVPRVSGMVHEMLDQDHDYDFDYDYDYDFDYDYDYDFDFDFDYDFDFDFDFDFHFGSDSHDAASQGPQMRGPRRPATIRR